MDSWTDYVFTALIGLTVGAAETLTRHRGRSFAVLGSRWSGIYVLLNAGIAAAVLFGVRRLSWDFGVTGDTPVRWAQVSAAGFGAMSILRSSVVVARQEDGKDIGIGPAGIVQLVLERVDNAIAAHRVEQVAGQARKLMVDIDYAKASEYLPLQCSHLFLADTGGAPGAAEMERIGKMVRSWATLPDQARKVNLGIFLIDEFGKEIVDLAMQDLLTSLRTPSTASPAAAAAPLPAQPPASAAPAPPTSPSG